ncbi:MAG: hypothetical protein EBU67_06370 [Actinobacteria bacterium]|nr:hypothetical protein [Actinomycetota bacterium]
MNEVVKANFGTVNVPARPRLQFVTEAESSCEIPDELPERFALTFDVPRTDCIVPEKETLLPEESIFTFSVMLGYEIPARVKLVAVDWNTKPSAVSCVATSKVALPNCALN